MRFWNKLLQERSKSNNWKEKDHHENIICYDETIVTSQKNKPQQHNLELYRKRIKLVVP
jgi:hypothetical protein